MERFQQSNVSFENLPATPKERHEVLVDLFGQYLFWVRNQTVERMTALVESVEDREKLGRIHRAAYEETAKLSPEDRQRAYRLVESMLGVFAKKILTMISGQGFDDPIGPRHVFRYRLDMEVCDSETGDVVFEETINRNGEKFFPEYWGRWLNRYG
jgi:hypothetical protein